MATTMISGASWTAVGVPLDTDTDTLSGIENRIGTDYDDTLIGDAGPNTLETRLPQPWHSVPMRALIAALCLLATPALADVTGIPTVIDGDTIEAVFLDI